MRARILALAAGVTLLAQISFAHFTLTQPPSFVTTENGGKGAPPCGEGTPSNIVTKVQGGRPLTIKLTEFVYHPGHYRIALSVNSRAELPLDSEVVTNNGRSVSASIQTAPKIPVLADGVFAHNTKPANNEYQTDVMLPNLNCAKCTLQVIEFMAEHGFNVGGGFYYHHCADLQITADPSLPRADPAWGRLPKQEPAK